MNYLQKVGRTLREARAEQRTCGAVAATRLLLRHFYNKSTMVLFECREKRLQSAVPTGLQLVQVRAAHRKEFETAMQQAGAGSDVTNFDRGAMAWLLLTESTGVALGWRFNRSPLFATLGYDPASTIYLGGFHVREEYRGQGLYPYLLQQIFSDSPDALCAIAETAVGNVASQRGLVKAGFRRLGLVTRTTLCGLQHCRHEGSDCL